MISPIPKSAVTKREALRQLLADGQWHHMSELRKAGGWRYGARLLELRQLERSLVMEHRNISGGDNEFEYRAAWTEQAELPLKGKPTTKLAQLKSENERLRRRVAELEGAGAAA